jgi:hypothetical protein
MPSTLDWGVLRNESGKQRTRARKGLSQVRSLQTEVRALWEQAESFADEAAASWTPLRKRPDWSDIRSAILTDARDTMSRRDAERLVEVVGKRSARQMKAQILNPLQDIAADLNETSESWHAALVGAELAQAVGSFNLRVRPPLPEPDLMASWLRSQNKTLRDHQRRIWTALGRADAADLAAGSKALLAWASGETLDTALKTAAALARTRSTTRSRWALGPQALATADLIRGLLFGQALAHRAAWSELAGLSYSRMWREAASRLAYPTQWRPPPNVKTGDLWADGARYAGQTVTVEGVVGPVTNLHVRRKVLSSAWLSNDQGHSVRVGIPHFKLDSAGFVEGAYAKVSGEYSLADQEFGTPLVTVGRRSLKEDAQHSWEDWVHFQVRRVFTPVPHGLTLTWSWERGLDGASNQLRYGTWLPFRQEVAHG